MKVNAKGQVTIPQHLRKKAGFVPGTEVEFTQAEDGTLDLWKVGKDGRGQRIVEAMRGAGTGQMTTDEILALTRGRRPVR